MLMLRQKSSCSSKNFEEEPSEYEMQSQDVFYGNQGSQPQQKINYETLIKYHKFYGNKWKLISNQLPGTSDSFIKNMFYTLTRKALRKINVYIQLNSKLNNKKAKVFKLNFVFKLVNLAQSQRMSDSKQNFDKLKSFYSKLLYNLLEVGKTQLCQFKKISQLDAISIQDDLFTSNIESLTQNLRTIQRIFIEQNLTKKGRTKKKFPKKGLIQKAYSSKAFKNSFDDLQQLSFQTLSTTPFKQYKGDEKQPQTLSQKLKKEAMVCYLQIFNQANFQLKSEFDNCLEQKSFDPILFQ